MPYDPDFESGPEEMSLLPQYITSGDITPENATPPPSNGLTKSRKRNRHSIEHDSTPNGPRTMTPSAKIQQQPSHRRTRSQTNSPENGQVTVMLSSPVRKEAFVEIADGASLSPEKNASNSPEKGTEEDGSEAEEESLELVTSDINPRPRKRQQTSHPAAELPEIASDNSQSPGAKEANPSLSTPGIRKRGRPVGWRPGMGSYAALRGVDITLAPKLAKPPGGVPKKRGRKPRPPSPPPRHIYDSLKPTFLQFRCEWEGCPAQLHNAETLRRHLAIVHGKSSHCHWGMCGNEDGETRKLVGIPDLEFFKGHVEKHMDAILWQVGDGIQNSGGIPRTVVERGDAEPLPSYLFDEKGRQVTPSIRDQRTETTEERKERLKKTGRVIIKAVENAPDESE